MRSIVKAYWDSKLPIYDIRLSQLQKEGINCLLIDVDGTLINRKSSRIPKAVCRVNIESESAIPPDEADVWVIFSPVHLFNADP